MQYLPREYTRRRLANELTQPIKLTFYVCDGEIKERTTKMNPAPTSKTVGKILKALKNANIPGMKFEFERELPTRIKEATNFSTSQTIRGKVSKCVIPLIQYVLDESEFVYLKSYKDILRWIVEDKDRKKYLASLYIEAVQETYYQLQEKENGDNFETYGYCNELRLGASQNLLSGSGLQRRQSGACN